MKYLIGIDGGGTNSRLLAVGIDGSLIGECRGKSTNVDSNPQSVVLHNFKLLINAFCSKYNCSLDDCVGLCFGTAGVDSEASRRMMEQMLDSLDIACPRKVVNDAEVALYANTRGKPGIMLISGTGSIAYGINEKRQVWRAGGFDYLVGDEGSAYWVAKRGVSAALKAYDRTGDETCMLNDICKYLHLNSVDEIVDFVYKKNKSDLADLCRVVTEASRKSDAVAMRIMDEAADELVCMVRAVAETLNMGKKEYPLILGGGFLLHDRQLHQRVCERIASFLPQLKAEPMSVSAEWGAVYIAAELAGISFPEGVHGGTMEEST